MKRALLTAMFACAVTAACNSKSQVPRLSTGSSALQVENDAKTVLPLLSSGGPNTWRYDQCVAEKAAFPFSFRVGSDRFTAQPSRSVWDVKSALVSQVSGLTQWRVEILHRTSRIKVICDIKEYTEFAAFEWVLRFMNGSTTVSPLLAEVKAADVSWQSETAGKAQLNYSVGSQEDGFHQYNDFTPMRAGLASGKSVTLAPTNGESSSSIMPFFNMEMPDQSGVVLAVGWTGQWQAKFVGQSAKSVAVTIGQQQFAAQLLANESVRTPSILVMPWRGVRQDAQNKFRKLLQAHFAPRSAGGEPIKPHLSASTALIADITKIKESDMRAMLRNMADLNIPFDVFWQDAGWYPVLNNNWLYGVGDWLADAARFPNGLKAIGDRARAQGLKFLLWFEPERLAAGSQILPMLRNAHPDWLMSIPGGASGSVSDPNIFTALHLGHDTARQWLIGRMAFYLNSYGVDILRQDMNIHTLFDMWTQRDSSDEANFAAGGINAKRTGLNEAKYIAGLYEYWEALQAARPELVIDNCASGGRRIDIETMRRTVTLWRSDKVVDPQDGSIGWDPDEQQSQMLGLSQWHPLQGRGTDFHTDPATFKYKFRSGYGWHMVQALPFTLSPTEPIWALVRREVELWRALNKFFTGDYYPLVGDDIWTDPAYLSRPDIWVGWQFHRPDLMQGFVQVFRRSKSTNSSFVIKLQGLEPTANYVVTDVDAQSTSVMRSGQELMDRGMTVTAAPQSALILKYQKEK